MGSPLVSMICPTFNRPEYLLHAIDLFMRYTYQKSELVVVDDSDPAKRPDLSKFSRVKHVKLADRTSLGEKHNIGNAVAQGDVIGFHDDDDWFGPRRLVRQLDMLLRGYAKVVGFRREFILEAGDPLQWWKMSHSARTPATWIGNGATNFRIPIHDGSALFSREILNTGARFPHRTMNEKVDFLNAAVIAKATWSVIPNEELFVYVRHGKNTWRYDERAVHAPVSRPTWFPEKDAEFYRRAAL